MNDVLNMPKSWVQATISDLGRVVSGGTPSTKENSYWGGNISWISPSDLTGYSNKHIIKGAKSITQDGLKNSSAAIMPAGSIHFSSRAPIGYTVISSTDMTTNQGFKSLVPAQGVFNEYIYYYFKSAKQLAESKATGTTFKEISGAAFSKLPVPLPPTNEQHRIVAKIEELFSELDKGIENLKTAQAQLKVYRQALLKHAFEGKLTAQWRAERHAKQSVAPAKAGAQPLNDMDSRPTPSRGLALRGNDEVEGGNDKPLESADTLLKRIQQERAQRYQQQLADWEASGKQGSKPKPPKSLPPLTAEELAELPELPEGWGWFLMGDVCLESILGKMLDKEKNKGELKPYLRNINVRWGKFALDNLLEMRFEESEYVRFGLKDGDLVICEGGEPGRCAVWRKELGQDMQIQKALHRVRFTDSMNSSFVQMYFELCASNRRLEKMFTGTTIKHLTGEKLARMAVPICSINEQARILLALESKFSEADQLDQTITTALQQAEALRQSILKKAFSGRLVPQDPNDEPASELLARIRAERDAPSAKPKLTNTTRKSL